MMGKFFVEIIRDDTGEVVKRMGPMSGRKADKVFYGASINLDCDKYSIRIVEEVE